VYKPSRLLRDLGPMIAREGEGIAGLHVYTFNNVAATVAWRDDERASLRT
jgi:hypothetical protein